MSLGLLPGVQPSSRLEPGPTVIPFGLQADERNDTGVCVWVKCTQHGRRFGKRRRVDHQHPAVASYRAGKLAVVAARRVVGDDRDRVIEPLGLRLPRRLLQRQPKASRYDRGIDGNLGDNADVADPGIAVGGEQCGEGRVFRVVGGKQQFAVGGQRHFVDAGRAAGRNCLSRRNIGARRIQVKHLERAVAVAAVDPPAVRGNAIGSRLGCCSRLR